MDESACPGCRELSKQVVELTAQVTELTRKLDEAVRAGKRQAAPFRKGSPKPDPTPPGRKSGGAHGTHGHRSPPSPEQVTECHEAPLPDACPHCRGRLVETDTADQFQTEIPAARCLPRLPRPHRPLRHVRQADPGPAPTSRPPTVGRGRESDRSRCPQGPRAPAHPDGAVARQSRVGLSGSLRY